MSIASDLRTLALSRATRLHPVHIVLDDELRDEIRQAQQSLAILEAERERMEKDGDLPPAAPASLADKKPAKNAAKADIDRMIEACREVIAGAEDEARDNGQVLVVNLRRLGPVTYQREHAEVSKQGIADKLDQLTLGRTIGDRMLELCFVNCATVDGTPVDLTLDDLRTTVCTPAELDGLRLRADRLHSEVSIVDFQRPSSGRLTQS